MSTGLDFAWSHPGPAAIRAFCGPDGFVCRYLSWDKTKNLSASELAAYQAAGIKVVLNWEYLTGAPANGYAQGVADAREALRQATALGLPVDDDNPIYFSCDEDLGPASQPAVNEYYRGCGDVLGGRLRVGAYGSYYVLARTFAAGKIKWLWQTYAWSNGQWLAGAHIRQVQNGIQVAGADCDKDLGMQAQIGAHGEDDMFSDQDRAQLNALRVELDKIINLNDKGSGFPVVALLNQLKAAQSKPTTPVVDVKALATELATQLNDPNFASLLAQSMVSAGVDATFKAALNKALDGAQLQLNSIPKAV